MNDTRVEEAVDFLRLVEDAESGQRADAMADLRFANGEQWPTTMQNSRTLESRPCLTINEVDAYIRQVENAQRQQRPRIKVHPVGNGADIKIAQVIQGLCRHYEINSDADLAYDTAFAYAARIGWGYFRIVTDYVSEDSFDQDIFYRPINNPFSVYFDPNSVLPTGSDAERCLLTDRMTRKAFKKMYPDADDGSFVAQGVGDGMADWVTKEDIRLAEFFYVERKKAMLVALSDGRAVWEDLLPDPDLMRQQGIRILGDRESYKRVVKWCKVSGMETLEEKVLPGKYIPVVPVYGDAIVIDGKVERKGMVRNAKDPQRMINFWNTAITEGIALAPKAKWLMAEGQDEGYEAEWNTANISVKPVLHYKPTDLNGDKADLPQRLQPEPPPEGAIQAAMGATQNLQRVMGMYDPAMGKPSGPKSGTAIRAEQGQSELSNSHLYDNLTRSIKHGGMICLDLTPHIIDTKRVMRIIGDDGKPDLVTVNEQTQKDDGQGNVVATVLNDVRVGTYDIVMDTGPGYNTKRMESQEAFVSLMGTALGEEVAKVGADIVVRSFDAPGMEELADRLAASNPLAQVDEQSDVPVQAQMQIKSLTAQLQQAGEHIQMLEMDQKYRMGVQQLREDGANRRAVIAGTVKTHDTEQRDKTKIQASDADNRTWLTDTSMKVAGGLAEAHIAADAKEREPASVE